MKTQAISVLLLFNLCILAAQHIQVNSVNGLALQGYDVVSYFQAGPVKGQPHVSTTHMGTTYWFSEPGNRE